MHFSFSDSGTFCKFLNFRFSKDEQILSLFGIMRVGILECGIEQVEIAQRENQRWETGKCLFIKRIMTGVKSRDFELILPHVSFP